MEQWRRETFYERSSKQVRANGPWFDRAARTVPRDELPYIRPLLTQEARVRRSRYGQAYASARCGAAKRFAVVVGASFARSRSARGPPIQIPSKPFIPKLNYQGGRADGAGALCAHRAEPSLFHRFPIIANFCDFCKWCGEGRIMSVSSTRAPRPRADRRRSPKQTDYEKG